MFYHWLGREAEKLIREQEDRAFFRNEVIARQAESKPDEPICDGDFVKEETVEGDGFITVYCSGPIRPIND